MFPYANELTPFETDRSQEQTHYYINRFIRFYLTEINAGRFLTYKSEIMVGIQA